VSMHLRVHPLLERVLHDASQVVLRSFTKGTGER
jgi:hypothetical protein